MKKHLFYLLCFLQLASCTKEPDTEPASINPEAKTVLVSLTLQPEDPVTRAMDENAIRDANVYLFGDTDYHFYCTDTFRLVFEVLPGNYKAYIVTNTQRNIGTLSEAELRAYVVSTQNMVDSETIPMTAEVQLAVGSFGTIVPATIQVKRCAAKVAYTIEVADAVASTIRLRSVEFCNLPRTVKPFNPYAAPSTKLSDYDKGMIINVDNDKTFSGVQYLFENRQGTVESIMDQTNKSPENAPACASYLRILAQGTNEVIEYIVYLGENNTSDFNVKRNTKYNLNLVIQGKNKIDFRVMVYEGLYYGKANSVICTGTQVAFDVTPYRTTRARYYAYTNIYAGREYEAVSAKVVWQGTANLIASSYLKNNTLTVNTNGKKGNAVVAICDKSGTVLWSFHIWCTAGDAPRNVLCENYAKARFYIMDRNLGAFSNHSGSYLDAEGLIYQWGRKDPLPSTNEDYVYTPNGSGTFLTVFPPLRYENASAITTLDELLNIYTRNPANFIDTRYQAMRWYNRSMDQSPALWGDPYGFREEYNTDAYSWSADKAVYDPCPAGYRVSNRWTWTGFSKDGKTILGDLNFGKTLTSTEINIVGQWSYGFQLSVASGSTQGIYVPATQYRTLAGALSANNLNAQKNRNVYWNSTGGFERSNAPADIPDGGNCLIFQSNQIMLSDYYGHSAQYDSGFGFSVRCARE